MGKKINRLLKLIKRGLLEVMYPRGSNCIICSNDTDNTVCTECLKKITYIHGSELCIGYYCGVLKELILQFKYKKDFTAGEILTQLIEHKINGVSSDFYLTYIPLSKKNFKKRGFNQSQFIAEELGFRNNLEVINTLIKVKETKEQKRLNKKERQKNIEGSFKLVNENLVKSRNFILIDDVVTTGATLNEAERILKSGGANEIIKLTLARAII